MRRSRFTSTIALTLAFLDAHAQETPPPFEIRPFDQVITDTMADGTLWALGATWKMRIGAEGAVFLPKVGERAARHFPIEFGAPRVSIGGIDLPISSAQTRLEGMRATLDRGDVDEIYDFAPKSVEQSFRIERLPTRGEIQVRVPIRTEMQYRGRDHGLQFEAPSLGRVTYGDAMILDAANRRCEVISQLRDGAIEIVVPESFVRTATLPIIVDPLIESAFSVVTSGVIQDVDVAYDAANDVWLVVYQEGSSASDRDILARRLSGSGTQLDTVAVNISDEDTTDPAVANVSTASRFLVVWRKAKSGLFDEIEIQGRTRNANGSTQSGIFEISKGSDNEAAPAVGGGNNKFMVAWQENPALGFGGDNIAVATVTTAGSVGPVIPIATAGDDEQKPTLSDAMAGHFVVAWERVVGAQRDIRAAALDLSGGIDVSDSLIHASAANEHDAVVTIDPFANFVITWELDDSSGLSTDIDIFGIRCSVLLGFDQFAISSGAFNLSSGFETSSSIANDIRHQVVRDGNRLALVRTRSTSSANRFDTWNFEGIVPQPLEQDVPLFTGFSVTKMRCASREESLGALGRILIVAIAKPTGSSAANTIRGQFASTVTPGGITTVQTGCGGALEPKLSAFDEPFLCNEFRVSASGFPLGGILFIGTPGSAPLCPNTGGCSLGVIPSLSLPFGNGLFVSDLPCSAALLGTQIGMTAVAFVAQPSPGICGPPKVAQPLASSDTLIIDFQ